MSPLTIDDATERDVPLILSLIRELAEFEKLASEVVATEESLRESLFGERRHAEVRVARYGGRPAGFALFFHNYSTFLGKPGLYLEDLFVRPELRGHGIGRALLVDLARLARERDCGRLEWWVLDWNESAIGFYGKLGAQPMGDWTVYRMNREAIDELAGD